MEPDPADKAPELDGGSAPAAQERPNVPATAPATRRRPPAAAPAAGAAQVPAAGRAADAVAMAAAAQAADAAADMPRPFSRRFVGWQPNVSLFKPAGVPVARLETVVLSLDEIEALRLADFNGEYQEAAAEHMKISRATFARIVESARRKAADALIHGKALQIQTEPGAQPPPPALAPGACHRRGCGCRGHGQGRYVEYPPRKEQP